jgi:hypothetical protein
MENEIGMECSTNGKKKKKKKEKQKNALRKPERKIN